MAQYNLTAPNGSGYDVRTDFNNAVQSLVTHFSGATDPATLTPDCSFPYMIWADTGNNLVKQRTADDTVWITIGTINTNGTFNFNYLPIITMASSSTMAIGGALGSYIIVTGTTTITAFDTPIVGGAIRKLKFSDTVTVTYNASTMLLPGAANIVAYVGDVLTFIHEGSGVWRCIDIQRYKTFRGVKVYRSGSTQSIASFATTKVALTNTEYDTDGFWNPTTTRIEIPLGVNVVRLNAMLSWNENPTTLDSARSIKINRNGATISESLSYVNGASVIQATSSPIYVSAGNYFELFAYNGDSTAKTINYGAYVAFLSMEVVS